LKSQPLKGEGERA
jgi:hypothetical protein